MPQTWSPSSAHRMKWVSQAGAAAAVLGAVGIGLLESKKEMLNWNVYLKYFVHGSTTAKGGSNVWKLFLGLGTYTSLDTQTVVSPVDFLFVCLFAFNRINSGGKGPQEVTRSTFCSNQCQLIGQARLLRALPSWVLKTYKDEDRTNSLGNPPHCFTVLMGKRVFLISHRNPFSFSLCLLSLILLPCPAVQGLAPPPRCLPAGSWGGRSAHQKLSLPRAGRPHVPLPLLRGQALKFPTIVVALGWTHSRLWVSAWDWGPKPASSLF